MVFYIYRKGHSFNFTSYLDSCRCLLVCTVPVDLFSCVWTLLGHTPCEISSASVLLCVCGVNVNLLKYAFRKMSKSNNYLILILILKKSFFISDKYFWYHCDQNHNIYLNNSFAIQSDTFERSLWNTHLLTY